jgi:hypothetical protein
MARPSRDTPPIGRGGASGLCFESMSELRSSAFVVPGISALVGGAVGALLTVWLLRPNATRPELRAEPAPSAAAVPATAPLEGRVAALEQSLRANRLKESVARAIAAPEGAATERPTPADVAPIVDNPVFEAAVRDVMDRAEQERNVEREAQREEWRKRASEEWVADLGEKLRLTEVQKAKVGEIANGFWAKLRDLRQADGGPPASRKEWRERTEALRKATEAELAKVLDSTQLNTYRELDEGSQLGSPRNLRSERRSNTRPTP